MSALSLFQEFRPLFRMLEEPLHRSPAYFSPFVHTTRLPRFGGISSLGGPSVQLTDEGSAFTIQAELPGVRKEDVNVSVDENDRSVTIRGSRAVRRSQGEAAEVVSEKAEAPLTTELTASDPTSSSVSAGITSTPTVSSPTHPESSYTFSRTFRLPAVIDASKVVAQLQDGVLTLTIPKAESARIEVPVL